MPQMRACVALCDFGTPPEGSGDAANDLRLLLVQQDLELRPQSGNGRGLRRRVRSVGRPGLIGGTQAFTV